MGELLGIIPDDTVPHLLHDIAVIGRRNAWWMGWNLMLAWIPAGLALAVLRPTGRTRTPGWWAGLGLFILFLPNAPYVVTDLVHLRTQVVLAGSDQAVVAGVVPMFAGFIAAGYVAYYLSLRQVDRYLEHIGTMARTRVAVTVGVHALCAVGVVLGRWARLNSWEPFTEPHGTLERILVTLTWQRAPVALVLTFGAIWLCHTLTAGVIDGVVRPWGRAALGQVARG